MTYLGKLIPRHFKLNDMFLTLTVCGSPNLGLPQKRTASAFGGTSHALAFVSLYFVRSTENPCFLVDLLVISLEDSQDKCSSPCPSFPCCFWEGRKVPTKSLFEQEAPELETQKCSTKRGVREPCMPEQQRIGQGRSVREKSVRANDPIKMKKMKGAFPWTTFL